MHPSLLHRLRRSILEALHPVDGPEVGGEGGVADVLVGHVEVALVAPPDGSATRQKANTQVIP